MVARERSSPEEAIELLVEWLSVLQGRSVPISKLADLSGLAWATTRKYVDLIAKMQYLVPGIRVSRDGVFVQYPGHAFEDLCDDPLAIATLALFLAERSGSEGAATAVRQMLSDDTVKELEDLAFVERKGALVGLTRAGSSYANTLYSTIQTFGASAASPATRIIQAPGAWKPEASQEGWKQRQQRLANATVG